MTEWPAWVCFASSADGSEKRLTVVVEAQDGYNTVSIHRDMGLQNPVKPVHLLLLIVVLCVPTAWVLHRKRTTAVKSADNP